jgi:hypothetical protein
VGQLDAALAAMGRQMSEKEQAIRMLALTLEEVDEARAEAASAAHNESSAKARALLESSALTEQLTASHGEMEAVREVLMEQQSALDTARRTREAMEEDLRAAHAATCTAQLATQVAERTSLDLTSRVAELEAERDAALANAALEKQTRQAREAELRTEISGWSSEAANQQAKITKLQTKQLVTQAARTEEKHRVASQLAQVQRAKEDALGRLEEQMGLKCASRSCHLRASFTWALLTLRLVCVWVVHAR